MRPVRCTPSQGRRRNANVEVFDKRGGLLCARLVLRLYVLTARLAFGVRLWLPLGDSPISAAPSEVGAAAGHPAPRDCRPGQSQDQRLTAERGGKGKLALRYPHPRTKGLAGCGHPPDSVMHVWASSHGSYCLIVVSVFHSECSCRCILSCDALVNLNQSFASIVITETITLRPRRLASGGTAPPRNASPHLASKL